MTDTQHIVNALCEQFCNHRDIHALIALVDQGFQCFHWSAPSESFGLEEFIERMQRLFNAFPDMRYEVKDTVVQGDRVVVRWCSTGTWQNDYNDEIPATGNAIDLAGVFIMQVSDGRIHTMWVFDNTLHVIMQY